MKETYYVSEEKTKLGISIAKTEKQLIQKVKGTYSIYIGIPFCPTTCLYCSFPSFPVSMWKNRMGEYLDALFKELDFLSRTVDPKKISTVYIGGGTPTSFDAALLDRLLKKVTECFYHPDLLEFTVEAGRPDSITKEKLQVMRRYPISRISINPQTMKQETLDYIGRHHTVEQTIRCFEMAREEGFDNINMDLILGLPGEGNEDVSHTMEEIKKLNPENLTVHSLAQKRASRLRMFRENYEKDLVSDTEEMMKIATGGAESLGMKPYYLYRQKNMSGNLENIGFAKPGKEGVYNILMMEEVQHILAAGAGAMSKFVFDTGEIHRVENVKDVKNYLERTEEMMERKQKFFRNHPLDGNFLCNL